MDYKVGMFFYALAFLLGDICVQQLSHLPSHFALISLSFVVCLLCLVLVFKKKCLLTIGFNKELTLVISFIILILLGLIYSSLVAKQQLSTRLVEPLAGKDLLVSGFVKDIPVINGHVRRFVFDVKNVEFVSVAGVASPHSAFLKKFPKKIRLSWYYGRPVNTAESWQFVVRLKPPHGFMNPGGFDYESWLFQNALDATGYVRKSSLNRQLDVGVVSGSGYIINQYRQKLAQYIDTIANKNTSKKAQENHSAYALIKALAIGDKSSISSSQWKVLSSTGTSHLMAISGLHIGLAALFVYFIIRRLVPSYLSKRFPAQHVALFGGMMAALMYAAIAGLSIPTQRAVIMLFVVSVMLLLRRNNRPTDTLGFALIAVLLVDPLAVLSIGFWFSFAAVSVIFLSLTFAKFQENQQENQNYTVMAKIKLIIKGWIVLQLTISVFLLPLSLFMFQQVSLVSPVANFLLIPYISFLVVPVVLLAIVFTTLVPSIAEFLFLLAANMIEWIWPVLQYLSNQPYALWIKGDFGIVEIVCFTAIIFLFYFLIRRYAFVASCFSESKTKKRFFIFLVLIILVLIVPFLYTSDTVLHQGEYKITILDVGQGSAAVLQTKEHVLVFDTGARFSDRLDAGRSVVVPYLRSQGVPFLDYLIVSHGDNDHIGGAQTIIDDYSMAVVIGQDIENLSANNKVACSEGLSWRWDGIDFKFLSPSVNDESIVKAKRNNRSCVLQVSSNFGSVLFTGDIEKKIEKKLVEKYAEGLRSNVLIVPHHGSNTSSSMSFITAVDPEISLFSVGYRNRYRLPSNKVIRRYSQQLDTTMLQTATAGAITVSFTEKEGVDINRYRDLARKYWNHQMN